MAVITPQLELTELRAKFSHKVLQVVESIEGIAKNGRNEHFRYNFAQDADVLRAVRNEIARVGLCVRPQSVTVTRMPNGSNNRSGKPEFRTCCDVTWAITDIETGHTEYVSDWPGEAVEAEDKGTNKALTASRKYFLLNYFLIPTGDDPDGDSPEGQSKTSQPKAKAKAAPTKAEETKRADDTPVNAEASYIKEVLPIKADQTHFIQACKENNVAWAHVAAFAISQGISSKEALYDAIAKYKESKI